MPCVDDRPDTRRKDARNELDHLTDMLCKQCALSDSKKTPIHADVKQWWKEHKKNDASRKRAEESHRQKALSRKQRQIEELKEEIKALSRQQPVRRKKAAK
jgi:hypothetical protein